mgnify:CR=1 FL=1
MSRKIVIIPNFCESHLIKLQIPNLIDTINPDVIIYNEGLFPTGPESSLTITPDFRKKYCYKDTNLGFDTEQTQNAIREANEKYTDTVIIHNEMKFPEGTSAPEAYKLAVSNFEELGIKVEHGDYIFPLEPDIFHHENSKDEIQGYLDQIQPNQGFTSLWYDFLETQYFIERESHPEHGGKLKGRKICIRFGGWEFYNSVVEQFMTQNYSMLFPTELETFHYNWFRFDKYKELRFEQIVRNNPNYWTEYEEGLQQIKKNTGEQLVVLRPSWKNHIREHAARINLNHPKHIRNHPNYIHDDGYDIVVLTTAITRPEVHNKALPAVVELLKQYDLKVKWIFNIDKVSDTEASLEETKKNIENICTGIDLEFILNEKGCFYNAVKNVSFACEPYLENLKCGVLYLEDDWELTSPERFGQVLANCRPDLHIAMSNPKWVSNRPSLWGKDVFRQIFINRLNSYVADNPSKLDPEIIICDTDEARSINKMFIMMWEGDFGVAWRVNNQKKKWDKWKGNTEGDFSFAQDERTPEQIRRAEGEYHGNIKINYD